MDLRDCILRREQYGDNKGKIARKIHIAFGVDDFYIPPMGIMATSLAYHNPELLIVCHVFLSNISSGNLAKLKELVQSFRNICVNLYYVNNDVFRKCYISKSYSAAGFYRFLAASILYPEVDRVMYIDSDTLCVGKIDGLLDIDFEGKVFLAVDDQGPGWAEHIKREGIDSDRYFNAGFLYIDLAAWQAKDFSARCIQLMNQRRLTFMDQDALNILGCHDVKFIDMKYDYFCILNEDLPWQDVANYKLEDGAAIVHYAGQTKPWHEWCIDPRQEGYLAVQKMSPWRDWRYQIRHYQENKRMARYLKKKGEAAQALLYYSRYAVEKLRFLMK